MPARRSAFTLIELLVVISIIAILSLLVLVVANTVRKQAKVTATGKRMDQIVMALQVYTASGGTVASVLQRQVLRSAPTLVSLREALAELKKTTRWSPGIWTLGTAKVMPNFRYNNDSGDQRDEVRARFYPGDTSPSQIGESLEHTLEANPDIAQAPTRPSDTWYRTVWPKAWPASDWSADPAGSVPMVWETPWGRPGWIDTVAGAYTWRNGELATTAAVRDLSQLSPLHTRDLLIAAEVLEPATAGEDYRTDRKPGRPWNDAWGNPLIVLAASFHPPRHDTTNTTAVMVDKPYLRPRDYLITRSREHFGYAASVYVAVAAMGEKPPPDTLTAAAATGPALTWAAPDDAKVLRQAWLDLRVHARAGEWNQDSFADPPWKGLRKVEGEGRMSLLSAPTEIR